MYYATIEHDGRKFVCFVPKTSGYEISPSERSFVVDNLPVEDEWLEGVWSYDDPNFENILEESDVLDLGEKAKGCLNDCVEDGFLDD